MLSRVAQRLGSSFAIALVAGIAVAASPKAAEAATLSYSTPLFTLEDPNDAPFFYLPYFDPSLGKLDTVILELVGKAQTTVRLENLSEETGGIGFAFSQAYALAAAIPVQGGG
ncbi:MAG: choice-of-anchor E domain-containing protein, partial [Cyanobacteria bacterium Co-bin13]|nr:choice-of-anchor E domain-containing protein [Cyanobacteria bacterium Co-bin13]